MPGIKFDFIGEDKHLFSTFDAILQRVKTVSSTMEKAHLRFNSSELEKQVASMKELLKDLTEGFNMDNADEELKRFDKQINRFCGNVKAMMEQLDEELDGALSTALEKGEDLSKIKVDKQNSGQIVTAHTQLLSILQVAEKLRENIRATNESTNGMAQQTAHNINETTKELSEAQQQATKTVSDFETRKQNILDSISSTDSKEKIQEQIQSLRELRAEMSKIFDENAKKTFDFRTSGGERDTEWAAYQNSKEYHDAQQKAVVYQEEMQRIREAERQLMSRLSAEQIKESKQVIEDEKAKQKAIDDTRKAEKAAVDEAVSDLDKERQRNEQLKESYAKKKQEIESIKESLQGVKGEFEKLVGLEGAGLMKRLFRGYAFGKQVENGTLDPAVQTEAQSLAAAQDALETKLEKAKEEAKQLKSEIKDSDNSLKGLQASADKACGNMAKVKAESGGVSVEIKEADAATQFLNESAQQVRMTMLSEDINKAGQNLLETKDTIVLLEQELEKAKLGGDTDEIAEAQTRLEAENEELERQKAHYNDLIDSQDKLDREIEEGVNGFRTLAQQVTAARRDLQELIDDGKEGTDEYYEALEKIGNLREELARQNLQIEYAGEGGSVKALKDGLQGIAGTASLASGALGLFNQESEQMELIQTRIQSLLGVIVGLQETYAFATKASTIATKLFNTVVKSGPIGWIATAIGAAVTAFALYKSTTEEATDNTGEFNDELKGHIGTVAEAKVSISNLQAEWSKLTSDKSKEEWIKENKSEFNKLGIEVNNVQDAERLLLSKTGDVIRAMDLRARAAAYAALATKKYQEALENREEAGSRRQEKTFGDYAMGVIDVGWDFDFSGSIQKQANKASNQMVKTANKLEESAEEYTKKGQELREEADKLIKGAGFSVPGGEKDETKKKTGSKSYAQDKTNSKQLQDQWKHEQEMTKLITDAARAREDALIAAEQNASVRERKEREEQHKRAIEDIERQEDDIYKTIYEQRKRQWELTHKDSPYENTEGKAGYMSADAQEAMRKSFTDDEKKLFDARQQILKAALDKENAEYARYTLERQNAELQSMRDYLKEYGTYEQQRLAITQEYEERIREEAKTDGERLTLMAQRDQALRQIESQRLSDTFNFEDIFNNLGELTLDRLHTVREQLRDMLSNNDLDFKQYKDIAEQIDKVTQAIVEKEQKEGEFLGFRIPGETTVKRLKEEQRDAMFQQWEVSRQLANATLNTENTRNNISEMLSAAGVNYKGEISTANRNDILADVAKLFSKGTPEYRNVLEGLDKLAEAERKESDAKKKAKDADDKVTSVNIRLSESLKDVRKRVGEFAESLQQINANIQSLPGLMDSLGLGDTELGKAMSGIASSANDAMSAMTDFASGNYVGAAMNGINAINGLGETLGIWSNSNVAESEAQIDRLTKSNAELGKALDNLRDEMKDINLSDTSTYKKAQELANAQIQNGLRVVQTKMGEYSGHHSTNYYSDYATELLIGMVRNAMSKGVIDLSTSTDGKHSNEYYIRKASGDMGISRFLEYLTPDVLDKLRTDDPEGWVKFMDALRDADKADLGAADTFLEYVNNYSDLMQDIDNQWKETITNLSWDSLKSSFASALEDMTKDIDDWSGDLDDIFRSGVSNYLSTSYTNKEDGLLAKWYEKYFQAMESGNLDSNEITNLREEYLAIVKSATAERDRLYETLGLEAENAAREQQSATFNSAQNITYEQADAITGILTAQQIAQEQGNAIAGLIQQNLQTMQEITSSRNGTVTEMRNLILEGNATREAMLEVMKKHFSNFTVQMNRIITEIQNQ